MKVCFGNILLGFALVSASAHASDFQGATHLAPFDEEPVGYSKAQEDSAISRLQKLLDSGQKSLEYDEQAGYLPAILRELKVSEESQMLVFSKTSLQRDHISPSNPRAVYFNDDVYIGYIPGAPMLEISVADPKLGGVFYTVEQNKDVRPKFQRTDQCLECHASSKSMGVPGHLVRSFATDERGVVDLISGTSQVNHRTPFKERWGGWYVTGTHGDQPHRGNLIGKAAHERHKEDPNFAGNCTDLAPYFPVSKFDSPHSDIVALMVLEHQTHMHNFITRLNLEATMTLKTYGHVKYLRPIVEGFVKYLLFAEEAPLTGKVAGTSKFREEFEALGVKDSEGRSLREFDLESRMFKYPCSYLIYSEAFDEIPAAAKELVYARLYEILTGKDGSGAYDQLAKRTRTAILEILRDTKSDLPDYWNETTELTAK